MGVAGLGGDPRLLTDTPGVVGLAADAAGDVFFTTSNPTAGNHIYELTAAGAQRELPFTGISDPMGVAVDPTGDVFVADPQSNTVAELEPNGTQQTPSALFSGVRDETAVAVSATGELYVVDQTDALVQKLRPWVLPFASTGDLYVADYGTNAIGIYGSGASGRPLLGMISGSATQLSYPEGVAFDPWGDLLVANSLANTITEYPPGASGNATPFAAIAGPATGLDDPRFIAEDSAGNLYVINALSNSITKYAYGATGDAAPIATISGSNTGIDSPIGILVDPTGRIYVSNAGDNSITAFAPGSNGNVSPVWLMQGDQTQLDGPKGLALNASGVLFVANDNGPVTEYSTSWQGNRPSSGEISGPLTGLANSEQVLLDPTDNMLLVDSLTQGTITTYPAGDVGNIAPTTTIQVGAGSQPTQMAFNPLNP